MAWALRSNIKGPQGNVGPQGIQGIQGDVGPQGPPGASQPWMGRFHLAMFDGDPGDSVGTPVSVTPTNIGTAKARLAMMRFASPITIANIRWYGIATVANTYTVAIYRVSTGAKLGNWNVDTVANTWGAALVAGGLALAADTQYWFAVSTRAVGTTAGLQGTPAPSASRLLATQPGNMAAYGPRFAEAAVTPGAAGTGWPATLPALTVTPAAWAGGIPFFYLDAA